MVILHEAGKDMVVVVMTGVVLRDLGEVMLTEDIGRKAREDVVVVTRVVLFEAYENLVVAMRTRSCLVSWKLGLTGAMLREDNCYFPTTWDLHVRPNATMGELDYLDTWF